MSRVNLLTQYHNVINNPQFFALRTIRKECDCEAATEPPQRSLLRTKGGKRRRSLREASLIDQRPPGEPTVLTPSDLRVCRVSMESNTNRTTNRENRQMSMHDHAVVNH